MADDIKLVVGVDYTELTGLVRTTKQTESALGVIAKSFARTGSQKQYMRGINQLVNAQKQLDKASRMSRSEIMRLGNQMRQEAKFTDALAKSQMNLAQATVMGGKKMNRFGAISQQVGYQVGDFFVQVQSGTSALVAFGQQGTQLAGLLPGVAGAVIGISLAVGTMLARSFMQARDAVEGSADSLRAFQKTLKDTKSEVAQVNLEIEALKAGFESVKEYKYTKGIEGSQQRILDLQEQITKASKVTNSVSAAIVKRLQKRIELEQKSIEEARAGLRALRSQTNELKTQQTILSNIMDKRNEQRLTSNALLKDLEQQSTLLYVERTAGQDSLAYSEQKRAIEKENFDLMIMSLGLSGEQLDELQAQYEVLEKEKILLKDLTDEEKARLDVILLRQKMVGVGLASGRGGDPRQQGTRYQQEFGYKTIDELIAEFEAKNKTNKATEKAIDLTRELTDAQKQQVAIADSVSGAFGNFFMQLVDGTTSAKDAFRAMAADIIQQLYRILVVEQLVQSIAGAITGAFTPASAAGTGGTVAPPKAPRRYEGGGYTGSGPRSGGLDGKGGFMAMLHPRETVVDHTKGQGAGGTVVNQVFNISANTSDDTKRLITQTIAQASPAIINQSVGAVMNQRRRGGAMKSAFG